MTMTRDQIREVFMSHGFTIKEGQTDLKPYVYEAAESLIALAERALEPQGQALPVPEDIAKLKERCECAGSLFSFQVPAPKPAEILALISLFNQQPVAEVRLGGWEMTNSLEWHRENGLDHLAPGTKLYAHPPAASPAMADESSPIGWFRQGFTGNIQWRDGLLMCHMTEGQPLYTSPAVAQPVCQTCSDQGDVYVVKHEGELPSHDLAPCPDCTKSEAQPVADERAEYERMLRAGYQHDNVRRQERGLASTDELTEGQEREIAERVALKFPSGAGLCKDSPVAFSCARRAAQPTSWTMTCDKHCGDDAKCLRAALSQPAEEGDKA